MTNSSTASLGDVQFEPVAMKDFRLSVEGRGRNVSVYGELLEVYLQEM